jgi:hypothetical protein
MLKPYATDSIQSSIPIHQLCWCNISLTCTIPIWSVRVTTWMNPPQELGQLRGWLYLVGITTAYSLTSKCNIYCLVILPFTEQVNIHLLETMHSCKLDNLIWWSATMVHYRFPTCQAFYTWVKLSFHQLDLNIEIFKCKCMVRIAIF